MKHRHPGQYVSRKPKGGVCTKRNPIHSNEIKLKLRCIKLRYKNMTYPQLKREFGISKTRDDDGDGVLNYKDCRPWDRQRHSVLGEELDRYLHDNFGQYGTSDSINEQVNNLKRSFIMPPPTNPKMFGDESVESEENYLQEKQAYDDLVKITEEEDLQRREELNNEITYRKKMLEDFSQKQQ